MRSRLCVERRTARSRPTCAPPAEPGAGCSQSVVSARVPTRVAGMASELFCDRRLRHGLVQAEIGHDLLDLAVLLLKLAQPSQLRIPNPAVALLLHVERRIADAHPAADRLDACSQLSLLEGKCNFLGELALLHDMLLPTGGPHQSGPVCNQTVRNPGGEGHVGSAGSNRCAADIWSDAASLTSREERQRRRPAYLHGVSPHFGRRERS